MWGQEGRPLPSHRRLVWMKDPPEPVGEFEETRIGRSFVNVRNTSNGLHFFFLLSQSREIPGYRITLSVCMFTYIPTLDTHDPT